MKTDYLGLARKAAKIADDKKASDIVILNVRRLTAVADYFVIVTADSTPQINAILDEITKNFREHEDMLPIHREGIDSASWSVLDFGGLVVHIMSPAARNLYSLERLWSEARKVK